ncbi:AMP-binding protein [Candidatus Protochlamydia sp. W-9]|uniref:AMP-binding protein n=1 Tax=Candidatus Protochlamydia sp. W-9 TaxID=1785087 RepID=UPI00096A628F|nr:AMP-binding protein [Candidatus Protochlamydia sp. W-9]
MQIIVDIEEYLLKNPYLENFLFNDSDIKINKKKIIYSKEKLIYVGRDPNNILSFYDSVDDGLLKTKTLGMFSSGTTKGSQTLYLRTKDSIVEEIIELHSIFSDLQSKTIMIMVTPNHSFGLIPALLLSRRLSSEVYLGCSSISVELLKHFFYLKPQVVFAVPAHIRLLSEWIQRKNKSIPYLKKIIYGGAALATDVIKIFEERNIILTSIYGTTQTGAISVNKNINSKNPKDCGIPLRSLSVSISKDHQEIIVRNSLGKEVTTGDKGCLKEACLIVENRLDSIIFKNGNKIDIKWLESLISQILEIKTVHIGFEKNINGQPVIICTLPKQYEEQHQISFKKIKDIIPAYALPKYYYYL